MLNKILVAIDDSAASDWAFETALEMAKSLEASLLLVHVLDAFSPTSPKHPSLLVESFSMDTEGPAQQAYEQEWQQFTNRYDTLLKQKQSDAEAVGVTSTYVQTQGIPGRAICEIAKVNNIDLIFVGNHDRTNQKDLDNGSVSNYLVHHAPCSVTVIHPKAGQADFSQTEDSRLVSAGRA